MWLPKHSTFYYIILKCENTRTQTNGMVAATVYGGTYSYIARNLSSLPTLVFQLTPLEEKNK